MKKLKARANRRVKDGEVVSNKMNKTVVVKVVRSLHDPIYGKSIKQAKKYYAHDESNKLQPGTRVTIEETRPLSKLKRWRVVTEQGQE